MNLDSISPRIQSKASSESLCVSAIILVHRVDLKENIEKNITSILLKKKHFKSRQDIDVQLSTKSRSKRRKEAIDGVKVAKVPINLRAEVSVTHR